MIKIDYRNKEPIFKQVQSEILRLIVLGVYPPESQLPSVRSLAVELGINPNTIQKAYRELESSGAVYSVTGRGSFVSPQDNAQQMLQKKAEQQMREAVKAAFLVQLPQIEITKIVEEIYKERGVSLDD